MPVTPGTMPAMPDIMAWMNSLRTPGTPSLVPPQAPAANPPMMQAPMQGTSIQPTNMSAPYAGARNPFDVFNQQRGGGPFLMSDANQNNPSVIAAQNWLAQNGPMAPGGPSGMYQQLSQPVQPMPPGTTMPISNAGNPNTGVTGGLPPSVPTGPAQSQAQVGATPPGAEPQGGMTPAVQPQQPGFLMSPLVPGQPWGGMGTQAGPMGQNLLGMMFLRNLLGGQGMGGQWAGGLGLSHPMQNGANSGFGGQGGGYRPPPFNLGAFLSLLGRTGGGGMRPGGPVAGLPFSPWGAGGSSFSPAQIRQIGSQPIYGGGGGAATTDLRNQQLRQSMGPNPWMA